MSELELRCPPLPQTLTDALTLMHQPERLEVPPVTQMVERDPAVVARLLQTVNSAYYGLERSIDSTRRAVVMLGPVAVTGLVIGMNMLKLRGILQGPAGDCFMRLVRHHIATAFLTRRLHDEWPARDAPLPADPPAGDAFTSGLLHDFGKLILVYNRPDEAVALYEDETLDTQVQAGSVLEMEQLLFGYDHTEAGEFAARKLHFPASITQVIAHHHDPDLLDTDDAEGRLLRAVVAANTAAAALGFGFGAPISWTACMDHPVWAPLLTRDLPGIDDKQALAKRLRAEREAVSAYVAHLIHPGALPPRSRRDDASEASSNGASSNGAG